VNVTENSSEVAVDVPCLTLLARRTISTNRILEQHYVSNVERNDNASNVRW
jgi:hypothetical protein